MCQQNLNIKYPYVECLSVSKYRLNVLNGPAQKSFKYGLVPRDNEKKFTEDSNIPTKKSEPVRP